MLALLCAAALVGGADPAASHGAVAEAEDFDVAIIGGGWSGLMAAKYMLEEGLRPVVLEKRNVTGGIWAYSSDPAVPTAASFTTLTSSKAVTEMSDFGFPAELVDFPKHGAVDDFLRRYSARFELAPHVRTGAEVRSVRRVFASDADAAAAAAGRAVGAGGKRYLVTDSAGRVVRAPRLVVCSGTNQNPNERSVIETPRFAGFTGVPAPSGEEQPAPRAAPSPLFLHTSRIKEMSEELVDRSVLVYGAGESGSDLAAQFASVSLAVHMSAPRGQWFIERFFTGENEQGEFITFPTDYWTSEVRFIVDPVDPNATNRVMQRGEGNRAWEGRWGKWGHGIHEWRSELPWWSGFFSKSGTVLQKIKTGQVVPHPEVEKCEHDVCTFVDGSNATGIDLVVLATGFRPRFPFLAPLGLGDVSLARDAYQLVFLHQPVPTEGEPGEASLRARAKAGVRYGAAGEARLDDGEREVVRGGGGDAEEETREEREAAGERASADADPDDGGEEPWRCASSIGFVGFTRPIIGSVSTIAELQARTIARAFGNAHHRRETEPDTTAMLFEGEAAQKAKAAGYAPESLPRRAAMRIVPRWREREWQMWRDKEARDLYFGTTQAAKAKAEAKAAGAKTGATADGAQAKWTRGGNARLATLVNQFPYLDQLAERTGTAPNWKLLFGRDPRLWWQAMRAPYTGMRYRLNEQRFHDSISERYTSYCCWNPSVRQRGSLQKLALSHPLLLSQRLPGRSARFAPIIQGALASFGRSLGEFARTKEAALRDHAEVNEMVSGTTSHTKHLIEFIVSGGFDEWYWTHHGGLDFKHHLFSAANGGGGIKLAARAELRCGGERAWELISAPGALHRFHPFARRQRVARWPTLGDTFGRDTLYFHNRRRKEERTTTAWLEGVAGSPGAEPGELAWGFDLRGQDVVLRQSAGNSAGNSAGGRGVEEAFGPSRVQDVELDAASNGVEWGLDYGAGGHAVQAAHVYSVSWRVFGEGAASSSRFEIEALQSVFKSPHELAVSQAYFDAIAKGLQFSCGADGDHKNVSAGQFGHVEGYSASS